MYIFIDSTVLVKPIPQRSTPFPMATPLWVPPFPPPAVDSLALKPLPASHLGCWDSSALSKSIKGFPAHFQILSNFLKGHPRSWY